MNGLTECFSPPFRTSSQPWSWPGLAVFARAAHPEMSGGVT